MAISYKLENFEGPLDLLLHLIEKNKVDIYDIPIAEITRQYLDYVSRMEQEDLNVVSDFLVMAATLLDIKSQMLLPAEPSEDGGEEDPRAELVARLLEYKRYKRMALTLQDMEEEAEALFYRKPAIPEEVARYEPPIDLDGMLDGLTLERLRRVFESAMKRQKDKVDPIRSSFGTIRREPVSLETRIRDVMGYARKNRSFSFRQMLTRQGDRLEIVVTFLAVLELMKMGKIRLTQEHIFDDMQMETLEAEGEEEDLELEGIGEFE
ncbi:MAG: segregation/condensation protein A [Clostridiales bacterium]|nr:segregation/condensation protein A [Clostridiales bacterium]